MKPAVKAAIIGGGIGAILIGGGSLFGSLAEPTFVPGEMPVCETDFARNLLQSVVEQSPLAKQTGMTVSSIGRIAPYELPGYIAANGEGLNGNRNCRAMVFTSAGKLEAVFTMEWASEAKDQIWLQVSSLRNNPMSPLN